MRSGGAAAVCVVRSMTLAAAVAAGMVRPAAAITPDDPGPADVRFTISSATSKPISPYIYGMNFYAGSAYTNPANLDRLGGNRWTGYNWETNASNAGRDWYFRNDTHMGTAADGPAGAVRDALESASDNQRGLVVTVPMSGYVAGDTAGGVTRAQALDHSRFKEIVPQKGSPLSLTPNANDGVVYTDEYVNWVEQNKGDASVLYSLDNEPGLWGETLPANWSPGVQFQTNPSPEGRTHGALHPSAPTFLELRNKTIATAAAIKSVNQDALVLGGVGYGWNDFVSLQGAPDQGSRGPVVDYDGNENSGPNKGEMGFHEYLLDSVKREDDARGLTAQGRTLMDVLDLHWYPEARSGTDPDSNPGTRIADDNSTNPSAALINARVQAPRSLWDPTYSEVSWISKWSVGNGPGAFGQIKLLPRVQQDIDNFKPGTKIAITEYNYGGTGHISGGVAQADVLGIFGREGVFAASMWDSYGATNSQFASGAFKMYLDYDGANGDGQFGDLSVTASTDQISQSAVYASVDSDDPSRMVLVAINRTSTPKDVGLAVTHDQRFQLAEVYQLTSASATPVRAADIPIDLVNAFHYMMPAYSVSTLVLHAAQDGDFNGDGSVDGLDLAAWSGGFGADAGAEFGDGDNDGDGDVDGGDFLAWQRAFGRVPAATAANSAVAEPATMALAALVLGPCAAAGIYRRRRTAARA